MTRGLLATFASAAAALLVIGAIAPACIGGFGDGPYACNPGYASCLGEGTGRNPGCETHISSDEHNCGACGSACPFSSFCQNGACTAPPTVMSIEVDPRVLAINSSYVYAWGSADTGDIDIFSKASVEDGGVTIGLPLGNALSTAPGAAFAVDDTNIYYAGTSQGSRVIYATPADGKPFVAKPIATFPASAFGGNTVVGGMYVVNGTLFALTQSNNVELVPWSLPVAGGTLAGGSRVGLNAELGQLGTGSVATDGGYLYFVATPTGHCLLVSVPLAGGSEDIVEYLDPNDCPFALAEDSMRRLWWGTLPVVYRDANGNEQCRNGTVQVAQAAPMATPGTAVEIPDGEQPLAIAVDSSGIYLLTEDSIWEFPSTSNTPVRIAGNLQVSISVQPQGVAVHCAEEQSVIPATLLLDDTSVYAAFRGPIAGAAMTTGYLLKIPKSL